MLFFLNLDGTVSRSDSEHVYQGQNNVAQVDLFALVSPMQTAVQVAFTLPNGLVVDYKPMSYVGSYSVESDNQTQVYHYRYVLPYNVTEVEGKVGVSFNLVMTKADAQVVSQTTYTSAFNVEYSALPTPPTEATTDQVSELLDLLQLYYAQNALLIDGYSFNVGTVETNTLDAGEKASVEVENVVGENGSRTTNFVFNIPQGAQGEQGETGPQGATPDISATAEVDDTTGTPSVEVTKGGTDENPSFKFSFSGLKGKDGKDGSTPTMKTLTITSNGVTLGTYNGSQDVVVDIPVGAGATEYVVPFNDNY